MPLIHRRRGRRNEHDLHVLGQINYALNQAPPKRCKSCGLLCPGQKDLSKRIRPGEIDKRRRHVPGFEYSSLDVKIPRKVQMEFNRFAITGRRSAQVARRLQRDGEAFRVQEIAYPQGAPDQHHRLRLSRYENQDLVIFSDGATRSIRYPKTRLIALDALLNLVSRLAKGQLTQRHQN